MGYHCTITDHAVFTHTTGKSLSIIALYIDDITMACKVLDSIWQDKVTLQKRYQMTNLGEITWILGMHVTRNRKEGWIVLSQEKFSGEILEQFGKLDIRPISTPTLTNEHLTKLKAAEVDVKQYQHAIGALMYPMLGTRPDLAYTVTALGRHAATPGPDHQRALDQAFHYLQATHSSQLVFRHGVAGGMTLHGY